MDRPDAHPITARWLQEVGFRWHEETTTRVKHWTLWMGTCLPGKVPCHGADDFGFELAPSIHPNHPEEWHIWWRADYAHRYDRFLFVRMVETQEQLIALVEAVTGLPWNPANVLYGQLWRPETAQRLRQEEERLDRRIALGNPRRGEEDASKERDAHG